MNIPVKTISKPSTGIVKQVRYLIRSGTVTHSYKRVAFL